MGYRKKTSDFTELSDTAQYNVPPKLTVSKLPTDMVLKANRNLFHYTDLSPLSEGIRVATTNHTFDLYTTKGDLVEEKDLDVVRYAGQGLHAIYENGELFYVDREGNRIAIKLP